MFLLLRFGWREGSEFMDKVFKDWLTTTKEQIKNDFFSTDELLHEAYLLGRNTRRTTRVIKKEVHAAYSFCVEFWLKEFHPSWSFNAAEGKALNEIIAQMEKYFKLRHERAPLPQEVFDFFKHFCLVLPNYYKSKKLRILNQDFAHV